ncbi:recombinase family protein [Henriciella sp.]|uniref:recombinase family protein n=1 Tax=Henriciella sp. TaxID=1968823 RepID=UPI002634B20D|nr:recombinase family protein [Henriciella sp.]
MADMSHNTSIKRCAIYTRKSTEYGLEQDFNSLDAQRESSEQYVASQAGNGWILLDDRYDDGGYSGGTLERPALQRLMGDIRAGKVDLVIVYKADRLCRSMAKFYNLLEFFEEYEVNFVSVTEHFNTSTAMGRFFVNMLQSFAQYEREQTSDRVKDKVAAAKKRGLWTGGTPPFGYKPIQKKLTIVEDEARVVRKVFHGFVNCGSATVLAKELRAEGIVNRNLKPFDKSAIYRILTNKVYLGLVSFKGEDYEGQHKEIISRRVWDQAQSILKEHPRKRAGRTRAKTPALLKGIIFGPDGAAMSPHHTRSNQKLYRYYTSQTVLKHGAGACVPGRIPAADVEILVLNQVRLMMRSADLITGTFREVQKTGSDIGEDEIWHSLRKDFDTVWNSLFPGEQARLVALLIERVDVTANSIDVKFRTDMKDRHWDDSAAFD